MGGSLEEGAEESGSPEDGSVLLDFQQLLKVLDGNNDGKLSMDELLGLVDGHENEAEMPQEAKYAFSKAYNNADTDEDVFVGEEEMPGFLAALQDLFKAEEKIEEAAVA